VILNRLEYRFYTIFCCYLPADSHQPVMRLEHFLALPIACCVARTYAVHELVNRIDDRTVATAQPLESAD
jgi:hypothetical protein